MTECPRCCGYGHTDEEGEKRCPTCRGSGVVRDDDETTGPTATKE